MSSDAEVANLLGITPYTSMDDLKTRLDKYLEIRQESRPDFDYRKIGEELQAEYKAMCKQLQLPFYVEVCEMACGDFHAFISRYPFYGGQAKMVVKNRKRGEYAETHQRELPQLTHVASGTNKGGSWLGTIELSKDKYYTEVPFRLEFLGIKKRQMKICTIHFVVLSDAVVLQAMDRIRSLSDAPVPTMEDAMMVGRIMDVRLSEKIMIIMNLLISEMGKTKKDADDRIEASDTRLYKMLERFIEDIQNTGTTVKRSRFGISMPKSIGEAVKYLIIIIGVYFILGLILGWLTGIQLPGFGGGNGGGDGGGGGATPVTPPVISILLSLLGVFL